LLDRIWMWGSGGGCYHGGWFVARPLLRRWVWTVWEEVYLSAETCNMMLGFFVCSSAVGVNNSGGATWCGPSSC